MKRDLVVIGNGMVGHKFIELLLEDAGRDQWNVVTFCEEPRLAYDRVNLSSFFSGKTAAELSLVEPGLYEEEGVTVLLGDRAVAIDRESRLVASANGASVHYHKLVLATGSAPLVPPIPGRETQGVFVYRTIEDLEQMRAWAAQATSGVVIGGGLLGLEAANALNQLGLETHVVEFAPRLMSMQVDDEGGAILRAKCVTGMPLSAGPASAAETPGTCGRALPSTLAAQGRSPWKIRARRSRSRRRRRAAGRGAARPRRPAAGSRRASSSSPATPNRPGLRCFARSSRAPSPWWC